MLHLDDDGFVVIVVFGVSLVLGVAEIEFLKKRRKRSWLKQYITNQPNL
jgi:hypothetical protein